MPNLITVATYMTATEAHFAVNRLRMADIEAVVNDEHVVTTDFLLGSAFGWIKVQVREPDAERADEILSSSAPKVNEADIPWDEPTGPEDGDDEEDELTNEERAKKIAERTALNEPEVAKTECELIIDRAYRISLMGLILFPPLAHFYALYLLSKTANEPNLPPRASARYFYTFIFDVLVILMAVPLWLYWF